MTHSDTIELTPQSTLGTDGQMHAATADIHDSSQDPTRNKSDAQLQLRLISLAHQNSQLAAIVTLIALPIVALLIWQQSTTTMLMPWAAAVVLVTILRSIYLHMAHADKATPEQLPRLRRNYLLWNFVSGAAWGTVALLVTPDSLPNQVFLAFILGGVTAIAVVVHGAMFSAVVLFTLPALLPMVIRLHIEDTPLHTAMSLATALFVCVLLAVASRMGKTSLRSISLGIVNEQLVEYLEKTKRSTDHLNSVLTNEVAERRLIEVRLRTERDFVSAVLDTECGLVIVLEPNGRIVRFNRACEATTGYYAHEVVGRLIWNTLALSSEEPYLRMKLEAVLAGHFPNECEIRWRTKQGGERRVRLSNTALIDKSGKPSHIVATGIDITEHHAAEAELARSREDFRLLVEGISSYAIYMLDPEGRIISWNTGAEHITGYQAQDVMGTHFSRFFTIEDMRRGRPSIQLRMASSEGRYEYEGWSMRKGNSLFWATITISPVRSPDQGLLGFSVITGDLTQRKQTEDTIRALLTITGELNATLDIDLLMDSLVRQSLKLLDATGGYAGLFKDGGFSYNYYHRGMTALPLHGKPHPTNNLPAHIYRTRKPYRSADALHDTLADRDFYRNHGIRTAICCPILSYGGEVIGFIEVHNKNNEPAFSDIDEERLISVSQSASLAIQNALAYRQITLTKNLLSEEARLMELIAMGAPLPSIIEALLKNIEDNVGGSRAEFLPITHEETTKQRQTMTGDSAVEGLSARSLPPLDRLDANLRLSNNTAIPIYDVTEDEEWRHTLDGTEPAEDSRYWICPIRVNTSEPVGLLAITLKRDSAKYEEQHALIETTAHMAGIAIERRRAENALQQSSERLRALSAHLQTVREDEKSHFSRELHDELGSTLLALKIDTSWLSRHLPTESANLKVKAASMMSLIDNAITTTRRISSNLRPPMLDDLGLIATLEWQINEFSSRMGIPCDAELAGDSELLNSQQSIALFRISQEALTNIARHAQATQVRIQVDITPGLAVMAIHDNGKGIDPAVARRPNAHGVHGMFERVHNLGGAIQLNSQPGRGTRLSVQIPLHPRNIQE